MTFQANFELRFRLVTNSTSPQRQYPITDRCFHHYLHDRVILAQNRSSPIRDPDSDERIVDLRNVGSYRRYVWGLLSGYRSKIRFRPGRRVWKMSPQALWVHPARLFIHQLGKVASMEDISSISVVIAKSLERVVRRNTFTTTVQS